MQASHAHVAEHQLVHHFGDLEQQRESSTLGMWVFLITEIMFFGGMFASYMIYRVTDASNAFFYSSEHMNFWAGTINTVVLIPSSVTVVLAIYAIQMGQQKLSAFFWLGIMLVLTFGDYFSRDQIPRGVQFTSEPHRVHPASELQHPETVAGRNVLDVASGSGARNRKYSPVS